MVMHLLLEYENYPSSLLGIQVPRFISISKAALLANVPTHEIHDKIEKNVLASTRGKIHIEDLVECFPDIRLEEADMLLFVEKVKEESFAAGAMKEHGIETLSSLRYELKKSKTNEEYYRERANKYEDLILQLNDQLKGLEKKFEDKNRIQRLLNWLEQRLVDIRRND